MAITTINSLPADLAKDMKNSGVWKENSPVPLDRLSLVTISYFDFAGKEHKDGEMVVLDVVAPLVAEIFVQLHKIGFRINKIKSMHYYSADDDASMADNNSSAYCCRTVARTGIISVHAYGVAIDINPMQNPYVVFDEKESIAKIYPRGSTEFLNRNLTKIGMVEDTVSLWAKYGFLVWGGKWSTPIDYQHFQLHRGTAELLMVMTPEDGKLFIDSTLEHKGKLTANAIPSGEALVPLIDLYRKNKTDFFDRWTDFIL